MFLSSKCPGDIDLGARFSVRCHAALSDWELDKARMRSKMGGS